MKKLSCIILFLFLNFVCFTQIKPIEKKKCYEKTIAKKGQRFIDWECGKIPGIVDCNEKLELDPVSSTVYSQGTGAPFSGMCETCHVNGIIERRVNFVSGKEHGVDTAYYLSGCPMVIRNHIQGVENGIWTYYYDSTNYLAWEMGYFAGQKHGKHIYLTKNGDTTLWENYNMGQLHGKKITYYSKSRKHQEVDYQKGLIHGAYVAYNREGVVIEKINYKKGIKEGEATYFYDDGKLLRTENYLKGQKNGEFKTFYYQGFVQSLESYKNGIKEGKFEEYYYDQKVKRKAVYSKDVLIEEHLYDEQGILTKSFGGKSNKTEDDALPSKKKKKKDKFFVRE
jgi:antitoxin component YwqK of YwqJK toxin-antitoxin module